MTSAGSVLARIAVGALGAISLAIGARIAYTSYLSEKILEKCLQGGPCTLNLNSLNLQSAYSNARGEVLLGVALAVFGVLSLMYSFLFANRTVNARVIEKDQK
jgi:hypothetical protein